MPWNAAELEAAMTALQQADNLPSVTSSYATAFGGWERIRTNPPADLDPCGAASTAYAGSLIMA